jgi:plastocyanin
MRLRHWTLPILASIALLVGVGVALAHGPTVSVSYSAVRPSSLAIAAGATVHFRNANGGGGPCTLFALDGSFESPVITRSEGWHHTFDKPGRYAFRVKEMPHIEGLILVAEE